MSDVKNHETLWQMAVALWKVASGKWPIVNGRSDGRLTCQIN